MLIWGSYMHVAGGSTRKGLAFVLYPLLTKRMCDHTMDSSHWRACRTLLPGCTQP